MTNGDEAKEPGEQGGDVSTSTLSGVAGKRGGLTLSDREMLGRMNREDEEIIEGRTKQEWERKFVDKSWEEDVSEAWEEEFYHENDALAALAISVARDNIVVFSPETKKQLAEEASRRLEVNNLPWSIYSDTIFTHVAVEPHLDELAELDRHLAELQAWAGTVSEEEVLANLRSISFPQAFSAVARGARLTEKVIKTIVEKRSNAWKDILRNPSLGHKQARIVYGWIFTVLELNLKTRDAPFASPPELAEAITLLLEKNLPPTKGELRRLTSLVGLDRAWAPYIFVPLLQGDVFTSSQLFEVAEEIYSGARDDEALFEPIVEHPKMSNKVLDVLWKKGLALDKRKELARITAERGSPKKLVQFIKREDASSVHIAYLGALNDKGKLGEYITELLEKAPVRASEVIRRFPIPEDVDIPQKVLVKLLQDKNRGVRVWAMERLRADE